MSIIYHMTPDVVTHTDDDGQVIWTLDDQTVTLPAFGVVATNLVRQGYDFDTIVQRSCEHFKVEPNAEAVARYLDDLVRDGFLQRSIAAGTPTLDALMT